ncbi:MAG: hypothetical protein HQL26_04765 [Candidatus Omnitrophica bacterium]|nr:hypothetical protein [Candidatus Omnitrophota bacterium]
MKKVLKIVFLVLILAGAVKLGLADMVFKYQPYDAVTKGDITTNSTSMAGEVIITNTSDKDFSNKIHLSKLEIYAVGQEAPLKSFKVEMFPRDDSTLTDPGVPSFGSRAYIIYPMSMRVLTEGKYLVRLYFENYDTILKKFAIAQIMEVKSPDTIQDVARGIVQVQSTMKTVSTKTDIQTVGQAMGKVNDNVSQILSKVNSLAPSSTLGGR